MNRPACIKQIDQHVARARVTPYRLRTVDAKRVLDYVEHLERSPGGVVLAEAEGVLVLPADADRGPPCSECGTVRDLGHLPGCKAA